MSTIHRITFHPGYDKIAEGYGVHGMEIRFEMIAERGAVQFVMNTGWVPGRRGVSRDLAGYFPSGVDRGYHWPVQRYDGQSESACDLLPNGVCFYDGSGLNADEVLPVFIRDGEDGVWDALDDYYRRLVESESDWLAEAIAATP